MITGIPTKCPNILNYKEIYLCILFRMFIIEAIMLDFKKQKWRLISSSIYIAGTETRRRWREERLSEQTYKLKKGGNNVTMFYWLCYCVCFMFLQVCCFWKPVQKRKSAQLQPFQWLQNVKYPLLLTFLNSQLPPFSHLCLCSTFRGENVEDAFLEAAKKIYQNIQDGSLDLNAAESGVQHKPSAPQGGRLTSEPQPQREGCGC